MFEIWLERIGRIAALEVSLEQILQEDILGKACKDGFEKDKGKSAKGRKCVGRANWVDQCLHGVVLELEVDA